MDKDDMLDALRYALDAGPGGTDRHLEAFTKAVQEQMARACNLDVPRGTNFRCVQIPLEEPPTLARLPIRKQDIVDCLYLILDEGTPEEFEGFVAMNIARARDPAMDWGKA